MQKINLQQFNTSESFFRLPKSLFLDDFYKDMKLESKVAYSILRDRLELSIKNNWLDEEDNIYLIYTVEKLSEILGCGRDKTMRIKKELKKFELLEEERQGLNHPNRLYLGGVSSNNLIIKESNQLGDKEVAKYDFRKSQNTTSRGRKIRLQEVAKYDSNDTEFSDTEFSNDNDDNVYNNARTSDQELLVDHYQKETGQQLNPVQARHLQELSNIYGALLVSEAVTRAAINGTASLLYVEKVSQSLVKAENEKIDKMNQPTVPMTQLSDLN